jgi:putative membrane protein
MSSAPEPQTPQVAERDPRVYFAAERTLLAWTRTGIALMGLGFAIARFALYLRQMQAVSGVTQTSRIGSPLFGALLMVIGVLAIVMATTYYGLTVRRLREGTWKPGNVSKPAVALSVILIAMGIFMVIQLAKVS